MFFFCFVFNPRGNVSKRSLHLHFLKTLEHRTDVSVTSTPWCWKLPRGGKRARAQAPPLSAFVALSMSGRAHSGEPPLSSVLHSHFAPPQSISLVQRIGLCQRHPSREGSWRCFLHWSPPDVALCAYGEGQPTSPVPKPLVLLPGERSCT